MKKIYLFLFLFFACYHLDAQTCLPDGILFETQAQIDSFRIEYPECKIIQGNVEIGDNSQVSNFDSLVDIIAINGILDFDDTTTSFNFDGLTNVASIGGIRLEETSGFGSFEGLNSLTIIKGDLRLNENSGLQFLSGLESVKEILGSIFFSENSDLENIDGLSSLEKIDGNLRINANNNLLNLAGLVSLTEINGGLIMTGNNRLKNLEGLNNIDPNSISYLILSGCDSLSFCSVESICSYLNLDFSSTSVDLNALGCSAESQISAVCETVSANEPSNENSLELYPNPTNDFIFIISDFQNILAVSIYDTNGREVLKKINDFNKIDVSNFPEGIYSIHFQTKEKVISQKFVKTN